MSAKADYVTAMPREAQETKGCIRTFTGRYVNPLQLRAEDICIEDIAHHLSLVCRYTGACPHHYSVAQHSLEVSKMMEYRWNGNREAALAGLLHDASEAYLNDIASPVKHDPRMAFYRELDHTAGRLILSVFGVDPAWLERTKPDDDAMFFREVRGWWGDGKPVECLQPKDVKHLFLARFHDLASRVLW